MKRIEMLDDYYFSNKDYIDNALEKSKNKFTARALQRFYLKNLSISNSIQNIDFQNDYYACFLLIRGQIEHFLVLFYIWIKFRIANSDSTAKKYYEAYLVQEFIKRYGYIKDNKIVSSSRYMKLLSSLIDKLDSHGYLTEQHIKKFKDINRRFNEIKNEFSIPRISKFLDKELPADITPFLKPDRAKELLENYNYLSSFIHGGPSADVSMFEPQNISMREAALEYKDWSQNLMTLQRFFILYYLALEDEKIKIEIRAEIDKMIKVDK